MRSGAALLPFSPNLPSPKGPIASFPSPLEARQSLISRDSSLEDLGLRAFGMGEDKPSLASSCPQASSGQGARRTCSAGTRPLAWMDLDRGTMPRAAPSSRGKLVSSHYRRKGPGPPSASCNLGCCQWLSFCSNLWSPLLPTATPPGLSGQQAAVSSELRDNSLL